MVASYDQVVDFEVIYGNLHASAPSVGITVRLLPPSVTGHTWKLGAEVSDGSGSVTVTTNVQLDRADAKLVFIQNTARWRRNIVAIGSPSNFATSPISDLDLISPSHPTVTLMPGDNYDGSIQAQFRVEAARVSIDVYAKSPAVDTWLTDLYVKPPTTLEIAIEIKNDGNVPLYGIRVEDIVPRGVTYLPGSTVEAADKTSPGVPEPDILLTPTGVQIGTLNPGKSVTVRFSLHISENLGSSPLTDTGIVLATGMNYYWNDVYIRPEISN